MDTSGESEVNPTVLADYEPPSELVRALVWLFRIFAGLRAIAGITTIVLVAVNSRTITGTEIMAMFATGVDAIIGVVMLIGISELIMLLIAVRAMSFGVHSKLDRLLLEKKR